MKQTLKTITLTAALSLAASLASAATAYTEPVGALSIALNANADSYVAVPFAKAAEFQGAATAVDAANGVITTSATFATNYASAYYVRFTSGFLNGRYYTITANTQTANSTITVDKNGENWTGVSNTDTFKIVKYWTLSTLFPPDDQGTLLSPKGALTQSASNSALGTNRQSTLLIPNVSASGVNLAPVATYFVKSVANGGWTNVVGNANSNDVVLLPDTYFIIRNKTIATTYTPSGSVETGALTSNFNYRLSSPNVTTNKADNVYAITRPKDVTLNELGDFGGTFVTSTNSGLGKRDELFVYTLTGTSINRAASATYIRIAGQWRSLAAVATDAGATVIPACSALIVRKVGNTTSAGSVFYSNTPNY